MTSTMALGGLIVEAAEQGVAVPLLDVEPARFGMRVGRLHRVVDDEEVAAAAGERARRSRWRGGSRVASS